MAKQVTLPQLRATSERVKSYVDNHATANVIKTETTLWDGDFRFSTSALTPVVNDGNYKSFKGDTTNAGIVLGSAISDFDAIGFSLYISITTENRFLSVEYVEIPVENLIVDGHFPINYATLFANFTNNNMAMTGIGLTATHRIGFGDWLVSNANWAMGVTKITGIKYSAPVEYTTSEKVIGTYLGKTLYEKTVTDINVPAQASGVPGKVMLNAYGIEPTWTIVDYESLIEVGATKSNLPFISIGGSTPADQMVYTARLLHAAADANWTLQNQLTTGVLVKGLTLRYVKETL